MNEKIVYLGSYNNSNGEYLFNKALDYVKENKGDKFYYILPNGKLLNKYRNELIHKAGNVFDINLFTFDDVVDRLLENDFYTNVDEEMKEVLISKILDELNRESKLQYYRKISSKKGFIKILINIIGELKRSLITPSIYMERSPDTLFYREIGLIYREYERYLYENRLIDREGSFLEGLSILREDNRLFQGLDFIIIDQFFDFRPQEMGLLEEMVKTEIPIYINMPFNRTENFETLLSTLEVLRDQGFKIVHIEDKEFSYFEQMANSMFTQETKTIASNPDISMIKAPNNYLEMKKIAEKIKNHINKGIELRDMAIVLTNASEYKDIMFEVFEEETIPCSLNKDINLMEIPLIKEILHILELKKNNMDKPSAINRIKSNYFKLCDNRDLIEYILRKLDFESILELKNSNKLEVYSEGKLIRDIIERIEKESESLPERANIGEYINFITQIIEKYNLEDSIINIYGITKDYDLLHRDFVALNKFKDILEKLNTLQNVLQDKVDLEKFLNLLENYLEEESITEIQRNNRGINILTPVTARGHEFKVLFVVGLSQGKYPNLENENLFFKEENHEELRNIGVDIKNYYEKLDKESLIFTTIISTCTQTLYLTYSENSTGDEKDIPSIFLDEVLRIIDGQELAEKIDIINVDMDYLLKTNIGQLTTEKDIPRYLIRKYYEGEYEKEHFHMYYEMDKTIFNEINNNILCEVERYKDEFNQYNGNIGDEHIRKDIANIHRNKVYSISYLESYGICPYYFLLNNILKVEEMERTLLDFTPLDRGIITHDILKQYYYKYKEQIKEHILGEEVFQVEETYDYIINKMKQIMGHMGLEYESRLWQMRIENNATKILNFVKADLDRLSKLKKKAIPVDFEIDFGRKEPFEINIGDFKIPFVGAIDRIDKYLDEDKYILIDYKNSVYGARDIDDMKAGLSLQLPIYILSQKDKNIVAGIYGIISNGEFKVRIGNVDEKHLITRGNKGAITKIELEDLLDKSKNIIKSYMDSIHEGDFSVNPKECSPFCIYKNICRYEEKLEVE